MVMNDQMLWRDPAAGGSRRKGFFVTSQFSPAETIRRVMTDEVMSRVRPREGELEGSAWNPVSLSAIFVRGRPKRAAGPWGIPSTCTV